MTEPIELLQERINEINQARISAIENSLDQEDLDKINLIYSKYNVCVDLLKISLREDFMVKGTPFKSSEFMFIDQQKKISTLQRMLTTANNKLGK